MARPRVWLPTLAGACALLLGCGEDGDAGPSSATPTRAATATATATVSPVANAQPAPTLASGRWETRATIASGPRQETAVVALGGEVYVLGGFDGSGRVVATVEAYDPRADRWRSVADLPLAMHHANAAVVDGGSTSPASSPAGGSKRTAAPSYMSPSGTRGRRSCRCPRGGSAAPRRLR